MILVQMVVFVAGLLLVISTVISAVQTFVLPRSANVLITRLVFVAVSYPFRWRARKARTWDDSDRIMAMFAPTALLSLPVTWLILVVMGYTGMFWAAGVTPLEKAFRLSGSSLLTLGFEVPPDLFTVTLSFSEATIGLGLVALLLAYLPTMYGAFSKREELVTMLDVRAGTPPSAITLLQRAHRIRGLDYLTELWEQWEIWFADVEESHTSLGPLTFFRSPQPDRSWITAAGTIMDAAALATSVVDIPRTPQAQLCIRAGYLCLQHIADFFRITYDNDPKPNDPISITRQEFDEACDELEEAGVPLKADRDQAWVDYAGWRVNYDRVLLALAELTMAPYAPWSSDRGIPTSRPKFSFRGRRKESVGL